MNHPGADDIKIWSQILGDFLIKIPKNAKKTMDGSWIISHQSFRVEWQMTPFLKLVGTEGYNICVNQKEI